MLNILVQVQKKEYKLLSHTSSFGGTTYSSFGCSQSRNKLYNYLMYHNNIKYSVFPYLILSYELYKLYQSQEQVSIVLYVQYQVQSTSSPVLLYIQ